MEYCSNDLGDVLKNIGSFAMSEDHIKVIVYNCLAALNFIHSANIMHRDLKPGNILINDECKVTICDFGLSRCALDETSKNLTFKNHRLSQHMGSRWYRPPEIILV